MITRNLTYQSIRRYLSTSSHLKTRNVEVRVRFAPSPTGQMHLGGLRTALYNYIFAKQNNGKFILRIEDTDQARLVPGSAVEIEKTLNWAGLPPDESPILGGDNGPYVQSERLHLYQEQADHLVQSGKAYRCFCSNERLELLRIYQSKNREKPRYDGKCRHLTKDEIEEKMAENNGRYVIRFATQDSVIQYDDLVFGPLKNEISKDTESDPILMKSDGFPTYHFANVVDDHLMNVSHVLRGYEWIPSTSKHIQLYQSLGWNHPQFAHFPLISMVDGSKMSKRNNNSHVRTWMEAGYIPIALINFLLNMGGGVPKHKQDSFEIWSLNKIIEEFDFGKVLRHPGSVDLKKLNIYNAKTLRELWNSKPEDVLVKLRQLLKAKNIVTDLGEQDLKSIVNLLISRVTTLNDFLSDENRFIWAPPRLTVSISEFTKGNLDIKGLVSDFIQEVERLDIQDKAVLESALNDISEKYNIKKSTLMMVLRTLLTNSKRGLPIHELVQLLGKSRLLVYLNNFISKVD